jgi:hypothetical protein
MLRDKWISFAPLSGPGRGIAPARTALIASPIATTKVSEIRYQYPGYGRYRSNNPGVLVENLRDLD